jgi:hypothetical protein
VFRSVVVVALSVALQLAALSAPLVHAHPDEHATEHHGAHEIHAHFSHHAATSSTSDASAIDHDEDSDRAVYLRVFVGVPAASFEIAAAVPETFAIAAPVETPSLQPLFGTHAHDPPLARSTSPRAPPSCLS